MDSWNVVYRSQFAFFKVKVVLLTLANKNLLLDSQKVRSGSFYSVY
jgi:hypothetical protein